MIEYLINSIKNYFEKMCKYEIIKDGDDVKQGNKRTDPLYKDLKKQLERIYGLVDYNDDDINTKDYIRESKLPPLSVWDMECQDFFNQGKLIEYDSDFSTLLLHDYALIDYFRVLRISYSLIMSGEQIESIFKLEENSKHFDRSFSLYCENWNIFIKCMIFVIKNWKI